MHQFTSRATLPRRVHLLGVGEVRLRCKAAPLSALLGLVGARLFLALSQGLLIGLRVSCSPTPRVKQLPLSTRLYRRPHQATLIPYW